MEGSVVGRQAGLRRVGACGAACVGVGVAASGWGVVAMSFAFASVTLGVTVAAVVAGWVAGRVRRDWEVVDRRWVEHRDALRVICGEGADGV